MCRLQPRLRFIEEVLLSKEVDPLADLETKAEGAHAAVDNLGLES